MMDPINVQNITISMLSLDSENIFDQLHPTAQVKSDLPLFCTETLDIIIILNLASIERIFGSFGALAESP